MLDMKQLKPGIIRVMFMAISSDEHWSLEVNVSVPEIQRQITKNVHVLIQGGDYSKKEIDIPLIICRTKKY